MIPAPPGSTRCWARSTRLERTRAIGLPADLFSEPEEKRVALWRARAAAEHPSWLRAHPREVRLTLLACFCFSRTSEITDSLVDLLIATVHKMDARADYRVEQELVADLKHVRGKRGLLLRARAGGARASRRNGPTSDLAGGRRGEAHRSGARGAGQRPRLPRAGADGASLLLRQPLPQDAPARARNAPVPLQQHRPPPADGRARAAQTLRAPGTNPVLRPGRAGADRRRSSNRSGARRSSTSADGWSGSRTS